MGSFSRSRQLGLTLAALALCTSAACTQTNLIGDDTADISSITKEQADSRGGLLGGRDICQARGWYDDGVCDDFCPRPDPDCESDPPDGGPDTSTPPPPPPQGCGGFAGIACPTGQVCVDDPSDDCDPQNGGADCPGICQPDSGPTCPDVACTLACETFAVDENGCQICQCAGPTGKFCGGIAGIPCPEGFECIDDPSDDCDPANGGADCGGICSAEGTQCGGFGGFPCPTGYSCIDDPRDDCDPNNGGADCPGICTQGGTTCSPVVCTLACKAFAVDENGCEKCECADPNGCGGPDPAAFCAACPGNSYQLIDGRPSCQCCGDYTGKFCGGFAGFACPSGFDCIDDPGDDCDPQNGGADCGGICTAEGTFCGGIASFSCPTGYSCIDDPSDSCDPQNGGADCGGICTR